MNKNVIKLHNQNVFSVRSIGEMKFGTTGMLSIREFIACDNHEIEKKREREKMWKKRNNILQIYTKIGRKQSSFLVRIPFHSMPSSKKEINK